MFRSSMPKRGAVRSIPPRNARNCTRLEQSTIGYFADRPDRNPSHQKFWAERSGGLKPRHKLDGFSLALRLQINSLSTSVLVLPIA